MEQQYIIEDINSFEPKHIFECGQCFRWNIQADGSRPDKPYYAPTQMADIVYQIRCSIVHNKETELHFTYNNISDYKDIINLINTLSIKLSEMIVSLINDGANTPLTYTNKTLTLY